MFTVSKYFLCEAPAWKHLNLIALHVCLYQKSYAQVHRWPSASQRKQLAAVMLGSCWSSGPCTADSLRPRLLKIHCSLCQECPYPPTSPDPFISWLIAATSSQNLFLISSPAWVFSAYLHNTQCLYVLSISNRSLQILAASQVFATNIVSA